MEQEGIIVENKRKRLPAWACIVLFFIGFFVLLSIFQTILLLILGREWLMSVGMVNNLVGTLTMTLSAIITIAILLHWDTRTFMELGFHWKGYGKHFLYGTLAAVGLYAIGFGTSLASGVVEIVGLQFDLGMLLLSFITFVSVAFMEETVMRGYILGRLLDTRLNKFVSLFISATLFAALHLSNPNIDAFSLFNLVLAGLFLGSTYLYTRNLWFPIALHLFWNWIQGPILGYQVSGLELKNTLLDLHLPEESIWNGGTFGFEGSVTCTVLMILFTIIAIFWGEKRKAIMEIGK